MSLALEPSPFPCRADDDPARACCIPAVTRHVPWLRLVIGIFVAAQTMTIGLTINLTPPDDARTLFLLQIGMAGATGVTMLLLGLPLAVEASRQLRRRRITMELLFLVGVGGASAISLQSMLAGTGPVYFDVVAVLLVVYSAGRAVNLHSQHKALSAMGRLTETLQRARLIDGPAERSIPARDIRIGQHVRIAVGEMCPVDGRIIEGISLVRESPFTGEWLSQVRRAGDAILAGALAEDGSLVVEATSIGTDRRVDRLATLIDQARQAPTSLQRQADRLVRIFLPAVFLVAVGTFLYWRPAGTGPAIFNAMAVLLIACPCAAGLATPLAMWSVLSNLARRGLVVRSADAIERLAQVDGVIFDKTGTLSDEQMMVTRTHIAPGEDANQILAMVAAAESHVTHPVARALVAVARTTCPGSGRTTVNHPCHIGTIPGRGIRATWDDQAVLDVVRADDQPAGRLAIVAILNGREVARFTLAERLRDSAAKAIDQLASANIPVMTMTGDTAAAAAEQAGSPMTLVGLSPHDKHQRILHLRHDPASQFRRPLLVGDGVNDAAAMAASHAGIAMGSGADVAIETASATLHGGDLTLIPLALALSRRAVAAVRSNLRFAVAYNLIGMTAAAAGYLHPILASILMAVSSLFVAWRSFHATSIEDGRIPSAREVAPPAPPTPTARRRASASILHALGLLGQGIVLCLIGGFGPLGWTITLAIMAALSVLVARRGAGFPIWLDMLAGMVTAGGLGMNIGWWADLGFAPISALGSCCAGRVQGMPLIDWMNLGMLAVGVPAMYLLRYRPERFRLNRWCCIGPIILGIPAMCVGMYVGGILAERLGLSWPPARATAGYVLMMAGMCAGMIAAHATETDSPS